MSGTLPTGNHQSSFDWPQTIGGELADNEWMSATHRKSALPVSLAFIVSLLFHMGLLQWQLPLTGVEMITASPKPISLTINRAVHFVEPVVKPDPQVTPVSELIIAPVVKNPAVENAKEPDVIVTEANAIIREFSQEELQRILQQQTIHTDYQLPADVLPLERAPNAVNTTDDSSTGKAHFNDVFDPRLRARLQANPVQHQTTKPSLGDETMNIHGTTFVDLGGGRCLMGTPAAFAQETNWYMTRCPGYKDEGEQMMERVNQEMRNKFSR